MNTDFNSVKEECEQKMERTLESFIQTLQNIRTSRANLAIVDSIKVNVYGTNMPLNQLATLNIPDPHTILVEVWDKTNQPSVEKAIMQALDLTPQNEGNAIRIQFPPLTQERREQLIKQAKKQSETIRISIRNTRRETNDQLKSLEKDALLTEDDLAKGKIEIQKLTDAYIKKIDNALEKKEQEILSF